MRSASRPWSVASRIAAAVLGGYVLTTLAGIAMGGLLPTERAEAVLAATLLGFVIYAAAVVWVFAAGSARRAWLGLLLPTALAGVLAWLVT